MRRVKIQCMELNHETVTSAPKDASTLLLLRPQASRSQAEPAQGGHSHFEVLLLKRHSQSNVLGGAHVFAGGKCEDSDSQWAQAHLDPDWVNRMHASLAEPERSPVHAAALFVAALREAYEECGVLLASESITEAHAHANSNSNANANAETSALSLQSRVKSRLSGEPLLSVSHQSLGIEFDWHLIRPWSRWITPKTPTVMNKRFDARFFVALMPAHQEAKHDDHETTQSDWFTPQEALNAYAKRHIDLAAPQIMTLFELTQFSTVDEVMSHASQRKPPLIEPCSVRDADTRLVCFPADPLHPEKQHILPGPTRLYFKDGCFQPEEGLDFFMSRF